MRAIAWILAAACAGCLYNEDFDFKDAVARRNCTVNDDCEAGEVCGELVTQDHIDEDFHRMECKNEDESDEWWLGLDSWEPSNREIEGEDSLLFFCIGETRYFPVCTAALTCGSETCPEGSYVCAVRVNGAAEPFCLERPTPETYPTKCSPGEPTCASGECTRLFVFRDNVRVLDYACVP